MASHSPVIDVEPIDHQAPASCSPGVQMPRGCNLYGWIWSRGGLRVSLGASLMYFGDSEYRQLLEAIADAQDTGDWMYIRATVADPWGDEYETEGGVYRLKSTYDEQFARLGYRTVVCEHSMTIVVAALLGDILPLDDATLGPALEPAIRKFRWAFRKDTSYCNWLLQKA